MKKLLAILLSAVLLLSSSALTAAAWPGPDEIECAAAGDVDYDGSVTTADARLALRYAIGLETDETLAKFGENAVARADIDGTPGVKTNDARSVLRIAVFLDGQPQHRAETVTEEAKWTVTGTQTRVCAYCGVLLSDVIIVFPSKLGTVIEDANAFASDIGAQGLLQIVPKDNEDVSSLTLELNVDAIWEGLSFENGAFNGLLTKLGAYINETFADAVITLDGETVYNGKLLNTPVKKAIFSVFSGFFYKIANAADGVYGNYALTIDGEDVALTVKLTGSEANLAKVQSFAQTLADHLWADTAGTDLVVGVKMPDALMATVNAKGGLEKVNASTVGACIAALRAVSLENVIGSQVSAVNKLCATVCSVDAFVNKVAGKVTKATVTVGDTEVNLLSGKAFAPASADYYGLLDAAAEMLSDDFKALPVGSFLQEDGTYQLAVNVTVDVSNAGVMTNGVISETVYFVIEP